MIKNNKINKIQKKKIVEMRNEGKTLSKIADRLGVTITAIWWHLQKEEKRKEVLKRQAAYGRENMIDISKNKLEKIKKEEIKKYKEQIIKKYKNWVTPNTSRKEIMEWFIKHLTK